MITMKKILFILLLSMGLIACGGNREVSQEETVADTLQTVVDTLSADSL